MKFFRGSKEIANIDVDGSSTHKQTLQGIDILQFSFVLDTYVELVIGDFANWGTDTFTINKQPSISKLKTNEYRYNFEMESNQYNLLNVIYMLDNKTTFYLHADLEKFATHIITNLNRVYSGFQIEGTIPTTNPKNLYFENSNCFETLQRICKEFNVEFSISGKSIQIKENVGTDTGLTFKFKKGLRNIEREKVNSSDIVTRLYAYGGSRNIPKDYGCDKLRIEPIENNVNLFGVIEGVKVFDTIYPHREGTISSIDSEDICKFSDASMDFDINNHLVSKNAKLTFNTGLLAGYEFDIHTYNHSDKKFDIIAFEDENGFELPNENLKPQVGDKYVIHEIKMPQKYIDNAEKELRNKATEFLQKQSLPNVTYAIKPDKTYLRKNQIALNVGDVITIQDDDFGVSNKTRIIEITQSLADKYEYNIKVGDEFIVSYIKRIIQEQTELNAKIVTERKDRTIYYKKLRRMVLSYEELKDAIFDADGYFNTEKIKPLSIETSMLSVGAKGQQLTLSDLIVEANYQNTPTKLKVSDAILAHFTIEDRVKEWRLRGDIFDLPDNNSYYYLYAKCSKSSDLGTFLVTKEQIKTDNGGDYYHFVLGVISSTIDDVRSVSMTYGQTVINGKFIKTGVIQSQDGRMRIDLENGTIQGAVEFSSNSPAFNQMSDSIQPKIEEEKKRAIRDVNSKMNSAKNYADSEIASAEQRTNRNAEAKARELDNALKSALKKEIQDVDSALTTFKNVTFESFKDGIIDKAEKEAIKSHKELLANESADIIREYESIYNDDKLQGDAKSGLLSAKNDYQSKYNTLISAIDNAIRDNKITSSERTAVESGFTNYRNTLVALRNALNVALDAISKKKILLAKQSAEAKARELDNALKSALKKEIQDVDTALTTFKNVTFESFKDGIIDKAEKEAIKSHKELLENERCNIEQIYYSIYKDKNLKGKEKSTLLAIRKNYDSKYNTLISAIDNAIRDNKITSSERRAVESGFANYRDTLVLFRETLNVALDAISKNKILLAEQSAEAKARELDNALKSVLKKEIQDVDTALEDYEKAVQAIADKTDFLNKTTIEGAAIATGTLMVGNETGATAGITGVKEIGKTMEESTFLWSGSNFPNRGDATTRITNGGKLYAKDAYMSGEINATNGNVGGFEIKEDRIKSGNFTTGGLSLASTGVIFRKDKNHIFAGIGSNVMPASLGIIGLQRLEYNGDETRAIGLYIKVKPKGEDFFGNSIRRALYIIGNNYQVGSSAIFETEYMGKVFSDIVKTKISRTHSYIFTSGGGNVYLPNKSEISEVTGEEPNVTFELNFIVAKNCGAVTIRGVSDGVLLDNDAIPWEGGKGSLELGEGETLKLRYCNGYYYVTSLMR